MLCAVSPPGPGQPADMYQVADFAIRIAKKLHSVSPGRNTERAFLKVKAVPTPNNDVFLEQRNIKIKMGPNKEPNKLNKGA